ncbi:caspase family protein [Glacieibacterium frigidum]|uniref:Peptidase C14 caspase domain-containing protein n=1 Tax=Glacieibacterium frigidum TaxID=2593303 RepID=A0A552UAK9_9SPHN|nr:caspase family protein [Glacieibacterium frigidum]TRW15247.1 hypothetical protein FMM06_16610 [Glacieibacterium frigidum]
MLLRRALLTIAALFAWGTAVAAPLLPKIVMQANNYIDVAAWTSRDDFIVTVSGYEGEVTVWDVARRVIVDRFVLTMPADIGNDFVVIDRVEVAPGDATALVTGRRFATGELLPERRQKWQVDLRGRRVTPLPVETVAGSKAPATREAYLGPWVRRTEALTQFYEEDGGDAADAKAVAALPVLPRSHDGKWSIKRNIDGMMIAGGGEVRTFDTDPPLIITHADLSPDGTTLALIDSATAAVDGSDRIETRVLLVDSATGRSLPTLVRRGAYGRVQWLDGRRLVLFANDDDDGRDPADPASAVIPAPTLVVDMVTRRDVQTLAPRCYVTAIDGGFIGGGLANCRTVKADRKLWVTDAAGRWSNGTDLGKGTAIDLIAADRKGERVAIATSFTDGTLGVAVIDLNKGLDLDAIPMGGGVFSRLVFAEGGKSLLIGANGQLFRRRIGARLPNGEAPPVQQYGAISVLPHLLVTDDRTIITSSVIGTDVTRLDLVTGKRLPGLDHRNAVAGGFLAGGLFWAVSASGGLRIWDLQTDRILVTSYFFSRERFFAMTPDGRYDTNLGADAKALRWLMPDAPWQSLAAQTFMRDLYEPGLVRKVMDCARPRCTPGLGAVPDLAALNRTLPETRITGVVRNGDRATVTVAVTEGLDPRAPNGRGRSGIHDVRLFRDGKLVRQTPDLGIARDEGKSVAQWRTATRVSRDGDTVQLSYDVALPRRGGKVEFTAYAFNEDRVKGETARSTLTVPPPSVLPRRRVVVVAIGVDATHNPEWRLNYAANDANGLAGALGAIGDADVSVVRLVSDGKGDRATKRNIRSVLLALGGQAIDDNMFELADAGVDIAALKPVGPDDSVIISFSGHGTTLAGQFHLLPSDAVPDRASGEPVAGSLISSVELTAWLRQLDAGEIAMVIDACHSAASVDAGGFKPGPMGDPGLGQLAFDKGIRILAATQADDVAVEDGQLGHGLLSYALDEGLRGKADTSGDGRVTLGEWLDYGVARMPGLARELREGRLKLSGAPAAAPRARGVVWFDDADASVTRVQQPSLFDFTGTPGALVLRSAAR